MGDWRHKLSYKISDDELDAIQLFTGRRPSQEDVAFAERFFDGAYNGGNVDVSAFMEVGTVESMRLKPFVMSSLINYVWDRYKGISPKGCLECSSAIAATILAIASATRTQETDLFTVIYNTAFVGFGTGVLLASESLGQDDVKAIKRQVGDEMEMAHDIVDMLGGLDE